MDRFAALSRHISTPLKRSSESRCGLARGLSARLHPARTGASGLGVLFVLLATSLFVLPFLGAAEAPDWAGDTDPRGRAHWANAETPFNEKDPRFWEEVAIVDAEMSSQLGTSLAAYIKEQSSAYFGPESEYLRKSGVVQVRRLAAGRETYLAECAGCHGADLVEGTAAGDGAGPAARFMDPRPRNFRKGFFKFTSTDVGVRPLRRDLYRTVSYGLAGASMPPFKLLTEERRHDVVEYVRYIALRGEFEELLLSLTRDDEELANAQEIADLVTGWWQEKNLEAVFPSSVEPTYGPESIDNGRRLYMDTRGAGCVNCHGATGVGDGPSAGAFHDSWGYPIRPRDFTNGVYRAGQTNADLWVTIATGINGTPMGSFASNLSSEEIWNIVHFVRSLEKVGRDN